MVIFAPRCELRVVFSRTSAMVTLTRSPFCPLAGEVSAEGGGECLALQISGRVGGGSVCFAELWLPARMACRLLSRTSRASCLSESSLPSGHFTLRFSSEHPTISTRLALSNKTLDEAKKLPNNHWLRLDVPKQISTLAAFAEPSEIVPTDSSEAEAGAINTTVKICFSDQPLPTPAVGEGKQPDARVLLLHKPESGANVDMNDDPFLIAGVEASSRSLLFQPPVVSSEPTLQTQTETP